jgi:hypothetical protein
VSASPEPTPEALHNAIIDVAAKVSAIITTLDQVVQMLTPMSSQNAAAASTAQRVTSLEVGTMRQMADVHGRIDIVERSVSVLDETVAAMRNGGGH